MVPAAFHTSLERGCRVENILLLDNQTSQRSSILSAPFESILGEDPLMRQVLHQAETVAPTNLTVLLLGETGTGKGLLAQAIVRASERNGAPFCR